jgi:glycosyltransferase involved in cell wall biosynthesis/2-polyprenyl-3-methyl-5-hydroxy-6-metoxy-1,4-benzoquinol methylase
VTKRESHTLRVCLFGTYDRATLPRIVVLDRALRSAGVEVQEVHAPAWPGATAEKVALARSPLAPRTAYALGRAWLTLVRAYRRASPHDLVLVGYFGHFDVHVARLLAGRERVVLDMYLSVYDTVVDDRRLAPRGSRRARLARLVDRRAVAASRLALLDTREHVDFVARELGVGRERLADVPIGAEPDPRPYRAATIGERLQVLFFGNFVPLQGTPVIAEAIGLLRDAPVDFTIAGRGADRPAFEAALGETPSVRDVEWIEPERLYEAIADHDVVLGVFGTSGKAARVVPNKVFQAAAVGRALVTADTPAVRSAFADAAIYVPPGDPAALAGALRELAGDAARVRALGEAARTVFERCYTPDAIGRRLVALLDDAATPDWVPPPRYMLRRDLVRRLVPRLDRRRPLVDLGFGAGAMLEEAVRAGFDDVTGVDFSPGAVRLASIRLARLPAARRPRVLEGGLEQVADRHGEIGTILMFEVLEHIEDDRAMLAEIHHVLAPGGHLLLSVPAHMRRFSHTDDMAGHFRRYERAELEGKLRDAGFDVVVNWCYGFPLSNVMQPFRARRTPKPDDHGAEALVARSAKSGYGHLPRIVRTVSNGVTIRPFCLAQRPFLGTELGDGYVTLARARG